MTPERFEAEATLLQGVALVDELLERGILTNAEAQTILEHLVARHPELVGALHLRIRLDKGRA